MQIANVAAGIVVGKIGTAVVSLEELRTTFRANGIPQSRKILNRSDLALAVQYHRQRGERLVFTNGCFDLLHVGHVQHLEEAAALGDQLIVGLNSDRSVSAIKGVGRPVIGEGSRAQLLASLACVNYVTIFDEASPLPLIQLLRPEVLVKGGDYTIESVVGRAEVERYGGCVRILPFRTASSTTGVIETIRERLCGSTRVDDSSDCIR
jgi:D-beta-D-heptose 7-phosphate kinase / D-beta-D-heptose 1-phosphate adenosyltransferase